MNIWLTYQTTKKIAKCIYQYRIYLLCFSCLFFCCPKLDERTAVHSHGRDWTFANQRIAWHSKHAGNIRESHKLRIRKCNEPMDIDGLCLSPKLCLNSESLVIVETDWIEPGIRAPDARRFCKLSVMEKNCMQWLHTGPALNKQITQIIQNGPGLSCAKCGFWIETNVNNRDFAETTACIQTRMPTTEAKRSLECLALNDLPIKVQWGHLRN